MARSARRVSRANEDRAGVLRCKDCRMVGMGTVYLDWLWMVRGTATQPRGRGQRGKPTATPPRGRGHGRSMDKRPHLGNAFAPNPVSQPSRRWNQRQKSAQCSYAIHVRAGGADAPRTGMLWRLVAGVWAFAYGQARH